MNIETAKTGTFYKSLIESYAKDEDNLRDRLADLVGKWSKDVLQDVMERAEKVHHLFRPEIAIKVSVTIGNAADLYDEEEEADE